MASHAFDEGSRLRALKTAVGVRPFSGPPSGPGLVSVLRRVGAIMLAKAQAAFVNQRRGNVEWPGRHVPNIFGIIADLAEGRKPPARRFEARKAGFDRGDLYRSLAFAVVSEDTVVIGSNRPNATKFADGGPIESRVIDSTVRKGLYEFLYKDRARSALTPLRKAAKEAGNRSFYGVAPRGAALSDIKRSLGWLFNRKFRDKRLKSTQPARPFLGFSDDDAREIASEVGVMVTQVR